MSRNESPACRAVRLEAERMARGEWGMTPEEAAAVPPGPPCPNCGSEGAGDVPDTYDRIDFTCPNGHIWTEEL